jgi:nicotianamine synthase
MTTTTSTPVSPAQIKAQVLSVVDALQALPSLAPSPEVDALFSELVGLILAHRGNGHLSMFSDADVARVRSVAAEGEFRMEEHWSQRIVDAEDAWTCLREFPYYKNYVALVQEEFDFYQEHTSVNEPLYFVGSGPLPLSAILTAHLYGTRIVCIDRDETACVRSREVINALGLTEYVVVRQQDADSLQGSVAGCVILGAAVGDSEEEKCALLETLCSMPAVDAVVARTSEDLAALLYATVPTSKERIAHRAASGRIVNSVSVY